MRLDALYLLAWVGSWCSLLPGCPGDAAPPGSEPSTGDASMGGVTTGVLPSTSASTVASSTADDSTAGPFVPVPDGGSARGCDVFAQDCPLGEKCTEWANDGGSTWNATKCVPVVDDPAGTGESCQVEGHPLSGLDDCDFGAICLEVDPVTLQGTCMPFCVGSAEDPTCGDEDRICPVFGDGAIVFCVPKCNPVLDDCGAEHVCVPHGDQWMCAWDSSGDTGAYGDSCEYVGACDPGLVCVGSPAVPPGLPCEGATGCCTEICDATDPRGDAQCTGAVEGQTCQPWYEVGTAPVGLEGVGVCALPA